MATSIYSNAAPTPVTPTTATDTGYSFTPTGLQNTGGYNTEDWATILAGLFTGGPTGALTGAGINEAIARMRAMGDASLTDYTALAKQATTGTEFTPYTLTSAGLGTVQQTAPGVMSQTLTPQQQANVDAAAAMQGNLYGAALPDTSGISTTAFGNVSNYLTPTDNAQLTGLSTMFGSQAANQLTGYGAPTGLEGTTTQALQGAATGLGQIGTGIGGINQFGQQALQQGTAGLANIGAGTQGLTGLQSQYEKAASQAAGMLGGTTQDMAKQLYESQIGLMSPTQQRQQLELENRLRAQGRLGTTTAAYGGTPEQLALAKAQEEQKQKAAYDALTGAEGMLTSQQARALGLGTAAGNMAGTVSNLLTADQQRALGLGSAGIGAQQAAEGLTTSQQARALGLLSAGQAGTSMQDQLLSSQQNRAVQSATAANTMAAANQALRAGDLQTAASLFNIGQSAAQLPQTMQGQNIAQAGQLQTQALTPAQEMLKQTTQAATMGNQAAQQALESGKTYAGLVGTGLQERLTAEAAATATRTKEYEAAANRLNNSGSGTTIPSSISNLVGGVADTLKAIKDGYSTLKGLFGNDMSQYVNYNITDWSFLDDYNLTDAELQDIKDWTVG